MYMHSSTSSGAYTYVLACVYVCIYIAWASEYNANMHKARHTPDEVTYHIHV